MTRTLLAVLALSSLGCGSRVLFSPAAITAARENDGKVMVTARMSASLMGIEPNELAKITELCMRATWSETVIADAGSADGGGTSDAGVTAAGSDGGVTVLPRTAVGAELPTATQCQQGTGALYELRSSAAIPQRPVIVTLRPFESEASRAKRKDGIPPSQFEEAQFFSP